MATSNCPNCHQPVSPADDICENCGAVLAPAIAASVSVTTITRPPVTTGGMAVCPSCKGPIKPTDDICESCGAVVATITIAAQTTTPTSPATAPAVSQNECPQCHGPRLPGKRFCNRCGYRYASAAGGPSGPLPQTNQLAIGSVLNNKYKVVKTIGEGGMGAVYLADDQVLKRQVIIKALLGDDDPDLVAQSVKEREFLAAIEHANIVSIYDFITIGNQGYIVMEYVNGKSLEQIMEEQGRPFDVPDAIRYIIGILPAFTYLARLGLVYCDFKPQNVMLEMLKDGTQVVKLIDLGTVIKYQTKPDAVYGTHGFYAREAVKAPSPETDLYSVCRTLAYLVTQMDVTNPMFGMPPAEYYKAFRDNPALYRLLVKGTHEKPARRFHRAEDLADQLAGVLRLIAGGTPDMPVPSRLFVSGIMTTTGKLGLRGEAALDECDKAIDLLRYGDQALRKGNYTSAQGFYIQAIKNNPNSVDAHLRLTEIFIDQGEFSQALAVVTKVQRMAPSNWKVAWYTGRLLEAQGKLDAAADQYRELIADLPGELPPQQALARVYARQGYDNAAVNLYLAVLKADPGNTEAILGMTNSLLNLQRYWEVIKVLSGVSEAAAKYVDAQLLLCDVYLNRVTPLTPQNIEHASQAMSALAGRTEDPRYHLARGDVYRAAWQLARAQKLPANSAIAGVPDTGPRTLGLAAEESYEQYLRREQHPADREAIVRRKFEVAPWRLW